MTRHGSLLLLAAVLVLAPGAVDPALAQAKSWEEIEKPPLRPFTIDRPAKVELPNGMVLFLMEDKELPLIRAYALVRGGSRLEPAEKAELKALLDELEIERAAIRDKKAPITPSSTATPKCQYSTS